MMTYQCTVKTLGSLLLRKNSKMKNKSIFLGIFFPFYPHKELYSSSSLVAARPTVLSLVCAAAVTAEPLNGLVIVGHGVFIVGQRG